MPGKHIGQIEVDGKWVDIVKSDDKDYVIHCLAYHVYKDNTKRIVLLVTYIS